jgi:hypothetical protein
LPASLALAIWASNSALVWHAITTPSSDAISVFFFLGGIESFCGLKVSFEGWIARSRWWPRPGRVHAAFIGTATGMWLDGNDRKALAGPHCCLAGRVRGVTHVTALVGRLPCCFSKFQESGRCACLWPPWCKICSKEKFVFLPSTNSLNRAVNVFET